MTYLYELRKVEHEPGPGRCCRVIVCNYPGHWPSGGTGGRCGPSPRSQAMNFKSCFKSFFVSLGRFRSFGTLCFKEMSCDGLML